MTERLDNLIDSYITDFILNTEALIPFTEKTDDGLRYVFIVDTAHFISLHKMFGMPVAQCGEHFNKWFIKNHPEYERIRTLSFAEYINANSKNLNKGTLNS
jgi:hypothetical protein